jgi:hypothetical protein
MASQSDDDRNTSISSLSTLLQYTQRTVLTSSIVLLSTNLKPNPNASLIAHERRLPIAAEPNNNEIMMRRGEVKAGGR